MFYRWGKHVRIFHDCEVRTGDADWKIPSRGNCLASREMPNSYPEWRKFPPNNHSGIFFLHIFFLWQLHWQFIWVILSIQRWNTCIYIFGQEMFDSAPTYDVDIETFDRNVIKNGRRKDTLTSCTLAPVSHVEIPLGILILIPGSIIWALHIYFSWQKLKQLCRNKNSFLNDSKVYFNQISTIEHINTKRDFVRLRRVSQSICSY